jgi:RHS repeat-associated protein
MPRAGIPRALAALCLSASLAGGAGCPDPVPGPSAGAPDYQAPGFVDVPFARVNVLGGNLLVSRRDLDLDTRLGNLSLGATWNSADRAWRFGFEASYDGATFVDAAGARHAVADVAAGQAIPGTVWVRVDARTLRTKGGLVHEFDGAGRLSAVRWQSGAYPRLEYRRGPVAGAERLTEMRQWAAANDSTRLVGFGWDAAGRLLWLEDRTGRRAEFAWNGEGRLSAARDALDRERGWPGFRYEYAAAGALAAITSSEGERVELSYAGTRVSAVRGVGAGDPRWTFVYGRKADGTPQTVLTDPLGQATRYAWDGARRLLERTNAAGERTRWSWAGLRPVSSTTPDGVTTRWTWSNDDPAQELQASGRVVTFAYQTGAEDRASPGRSALRLVRDASGTLEERSYDAAGRPVRVANGAGEATAFAWNAENLLAAATDPAGIETRYRDYGEHGHARRVERGGREEVRGYDAVGNLLEGTGSAALPGAGATGIVTRGWDADRNLASLVLGDLDHDVSTERRTLSVTYRSDGRPARVERPYGGDSLFRYDALGRLVERSDRIGGAWRSTRYTLDALGRATAVDRPNGMRTELGYDAAGRRVFTAHRRGASVDSSAVLGYEQGRLASVADSAHGFVPERYAYDAAGRVRAVDFPDGERLELAWDARSRVAEERYLAASGGELRRLRFGYDAADRETELRDGGQVLRSLRFAAGRLEEERFGNGLVRSYEYDAGNGLLASATTRDGAGALVEETSLSERQPGALGHVVWRASTTSYGALAASSHEHFGLSPAAAGQPGPRVGAFASDAAGAAIVPYAYDVLGNVLAIGVAGEPGARTFHYDDERTQLLRVRRAAGTTLHEYAYDEAGFAVLRDGEAIEWDGGGRPVALGARATLAWDALGRPISASVDGASQRRLFGGRVRASLSGAAQAIELGALELDLLGDHRYRHLDFRGNVKLVTDAAGRVVAHTRYGPYGADRLHGVPDPEAGFAGGRSVADLLLLGARLYDPDVARFLSPDPVLQLVSQYAYADGNPVWYWDPDGRSPQIAMGVALGAAVATTAIGLATGNLPLAAFASAFAVGLVTPPSGTLSTSSAAVAGGLRAASRGPLWVPFAAFTAGQALQLAIYSEFSGPTDAFGDKPRGIPDPSPQKKDLEITVDPGAAATGFVSGGGWGGGGGGGTGGCSPTPLTLLSPSVAAHMLVPLLAIQALLAVLWVRGQRRS